MKKHHYIVLLIIIIFGSYLRIFGLGAIPSSYSPDELSQGYTAYSILQTGHDEWGSKNIFALRSFGDFKPPLQTLAMIPFVKIFGLTPFSVRLPNALFSSLTILAVFFLSQVIFHQPLLSLFSAVLLALSPWHLPMSRIALEANISVFFFTLAADLYLYKSKNLLFTILSSLSFCAGVLSYHSAKLLVPLFIPILIVFDQTLSTRKTKKQMVTLLSLVSLLLIYIFVSFKAVSVRTTDIAIFNPTDKWISVSNAQYESRLNGLNPHISRLFNNKLLYVANQFVANLTSYFSPQFLLTQGAGETTYGMIPGRGALGLIPFVGLMITIVTFIRRPKNYKYLFLFIIVLLTALPPSLAKGNFSANRFALCLPFIITLSSVGIFWVLQQSKLAFLIFSLIFMFNSLSFLQKYFYQGNSILAHGMLFGHKQANEFVSNFPNKQIIYSRKLSEPQAYVAFFQKIDPKITQQFSPTWMEYQTRGFSFVDQLGSYRLDRFLFKEISMHDFEVPNTIIVGRPEEFNQYKPDKVIYYPSYSSKNPAIYIYVTKNETI